MAEETKNLKLLVEWNIEATKKIIDLLKKSDFELDIKPPPDSPPPSEN
jgi:hypothetical protein